MKFPYGIRLPKQGDKRFSTDIKKSNQYIGLTIRGFFYAAEAVSKQTIFEVNRFAGSIYYYAAAKINGTGMFFTQNKQGSHDETRVATLSVPGYYSAAVRFKDADNISMFFDEDEKGTTNINGTINQDWQFRMEGGYHFLLSLHMSMEAGTTTKLGQSFFLYEPSCGIGGYWIMEVVVEDPTQPLVIKIQIKKTDPKTVNAEFPLNNVKRDAEVSINIRNTNGGFLVTTTFDDTTKFISSPEPKSYIWPSTSPNVQILRQYAEPGTERHT